MRAVTVIGLHHLRQIKADMMHVAPNTPLIRKETPEKLLTVKEAAEALGVHEWALGRAVRAGTIPAYAPFNSRKLVRLSEVIAAINASKIGG
jgi:excisionase family DNA binding protein